MTIQDRECTLVIPAYNEEGRIHNLLKEELAGFLGEIILVCDGTDGTAEIVEGYGKAHPHLQLRCLSFPERLGKGGAVMAGMREARRPYIGFMDADGSTSIYEMQRLFQKLEDYDGAIGSRWLPGSVIPVQQPLLRRLESRIFNILVRVLFALPYRDTQCGAKVFKKAAVEGILPHMQSRGFSFDVELLWKMRTRGYRIGEFGIEWNNRGDSKVEGSDGIHMLKSLLMVRFQR